MIDSRTLLVNVTTRDGFDYANPFKVGTLSFQARKGGRVQEAKTFSVTSTSTIQDLQDFMKNTMGIQTESGDSSNPMVGSINNIAGEGGTINPGAYISSGRLRFVSNTGVDNAVEIDLTSMKLTDPSGTSPIPTWLLVQFRTRKARVRSQTSSATILWAYQSESV